MKNVFGYTTQETTSWFKEWFNTKYYHHLYAHRSDAEAVIFIDHLLAALKPASGSTMLDVGCGSGRHCRALGKNYHVTGIDIAAESIREAKRLATARMQFYEHDMRVPFWKKEYDYVFSFFTSFGYFINESDHRNALRSMIGSLRTGGRFVMDYLNIFTAEKNMISHEEKEIDNIIYTIKRWTDAGYFYKQVLINDPVELSPLVFTEQVARFGLADFKKMFYDCGIELQSVYGDYELNSFDEESSPRLIMVAGKGY